PFSAHRLPAHARRAGNRASRPGFRKSLDPCGLAHAASGGKMSVDRFIAGDVQWAASACAQHILSLLEKALSAQSFATLAVSGGTTPRLMFDELAAAQFDWNRVHLFWVDERSVPPTDDASNYKLIDDHLIVPTGIPLQHVHRIRGEIAPQAAAAAYVADIRSFFGLAPGEMPQF